MNLKLKILLFFNYSINFKGCCIYDKNEKYTKINNNNGNENINKNNEDDERPIDDDKDKKPVDPNQNKNITRRPSYFTWNNGNCAVQVFCLTFIMIFRDNPEGLKLLENSNILFFQKVASMVKNYINYKKTGIKGDTLKELQEVYKEYCRFLVNESLIIVDKILEILNNKESNLDILDEIYKSDISERNKYDEKLVKVVEEYEDYLSEFDNYLPIISYFGVNDNYNLNKTKNYKMNFKVEKYGNEDDNSYNERVKRCNEFIHDFYELQSDNIFHLKEFFTYYKNDFTKDLLKTIEEPKSYGFAFILSEIFSLLKKHITNIENNKKFKNLSCGNNDIGINGNTIFIKLECCLGANVDISKKGGSDHCNCIYKDIDGKWRYAYGYNEEFLIDENLIKQKKFKEIVANNFGTFHYTLFSVNGFIKIKI